jgi:hypothetical protein
MANAVLPRAGTACSDAPATVMELRRRKIGDEVLVGGDPKIAKWSLLAVASRRATNCALGATVLTPAFVLLELAPNVLPLVPRSTGTRTVVDTVVVATIEAASLLLLAFDVTTVIIPIINAIATSKVKANRFMFPSLVWCESGKLRRRIGPVRDLP